MRERLEEHRADQCGGDGVDVRVGAQFSVFDGLAESRRQPGELRSALEGTPFGAEVADAVEKTYLPGATMGQAFGEVLQHFALERFLYRLSLSPYRDRFVLKGALLLRAWRAPAARPTLDIDLLGRMPNEVEAVANVMREDVATGSLPREAVLANAPDQEAGCFKVPQVIQEN